jgi:catechol 2,3-dioxygenase-like lactoylglutathione lyase family enzyme
MSEEAEARSSRRELLEGGVRAFRAQLQPRRPQVEAPTIDVLGIDHVAVSVGDLGEARVIYGDVLGLPLKFDLPEAGVVAYRVGSEPPFLLIREDLAVTVSPPRGTPPFSLEVVSVRRATAALAAAGIMTLSPPQEIPTGWLVEFADPWGNVVALTDSSKAPGRGRAAAPPAPASRRVET